jgi:hypothetical protein
MIRTRIIVRLPRPFLPDMRNPFVSFVFFVVISFSESVQAAPTAQNQPQITLMARMGKPT